MPGHKAIQPWLSVVGAAIVLAALALPLAGPGTEGGTTDVAPSRATTGTVAWDPTDVRVSDPATLFPGDQKNLYEPSVAIDPADPSTMLAFAIDLSTQNQDPADYSTNRAYRSTDGGATWTDVGPMPYRAGDAYWTGGDPVALFAPDGAAYFAGLADAPDASEGGIYVHRSPDGGATWAPPVQAVAEVRDGDEGADTCTGADKEWLSHDPATDRLYLGYTEFRFQCSAPVDDPLGAGNLLRFEGMDLRLTLSEDGGRTWAEPRVVWDTYALGAMPRTAPDGTLHMAFWATVPTTQTGCPSVIGTLVTALTKGQSTGLFDAIVVGTSQDGGATWSFHIQSKCTHDLAELTKPGRFVGGNFLPSLSVDPTTGDAHVVYPQFLPTQNRYTVLHIASRDGGATWTEPVELTPRTDEDARMPAVHAEDGVVRVPYLVSRDGDDSGDAAYVESGDGGRTWGDRVLLSTEPWQLEDDPDLGDYINIDVQGGRVVVAWTDARNGSPTEIWARTGSLTS